MRMNKRGQLQEISTFLVALFVISVFGLTMWKVGDGLSDAAAWRRGSGLGLQN